MKAEHQTSGFFTGNISPFLLFEMEFHSLFYIVESNRSNNFYSESNSASQLAAIGLLAYFEAFCKHQFAALVNLFPSLVDSFSRKRELPKIDFATMVSFQGVLDNNIGFVLAENFDFGTAKNINSLYQALICVTPFSKEEEQVFNDIVYKRNLLMHHAGYYTLRYLKDLVPPEQIRALAYKEQVKIDRDAFKDISDFLFGMAMKITRHTVQALKLLPEYQQLPSGNIKIQAVQELTKGIYDDL